jgi:hypothetical protein
MYIHLSRTLTLRCYQLVPCHHRSTRAGHLNHHNVKITASFTRHYAIGESTRSRLLVALWFGIHWSHIAHSLLRWGCCNLLSIISVTRSCIISVPWGAHIVFFLVFQIQIQSGQHAFCAGYEFPIPVCLTLIVSSSRFDLLAELYSSACFSSRSKFNQIIT